MIKKREMKGRLTGRHRSAWELVHGEAEIISYWKYRVRRLEAILPAAMIGAFIIGFVACAILAYFAR